jgi:small subunit ribosomal protein S4e
VKVELSSGKIVEHLKFEVGQTAMITGGRNLGRVGSVVTKERHEGSFDIVHVKDAVGHPFATRATNVFVVGKNKSLVKLPPRQGVKLSVIQERELREKKKAAQTQA